MACVDRVVSGQRVSVEQCRSAEAATFVEFDNVGTNSHIKNTKSSAIDTGKPLLDVHAADIAKLIFTPSRKNVVFQVALLVFLGVARLSLVTLLRQFFER